MAPVLWFVWSLRSCTTKTRRSKYALEPEASNFKYWDPLGKILCLNGLLASVSVTGRVLDVMVVCGDTISRY